MKPWRSVELGVLALGLMTWGVCLAQEEPVHHGKTLAYWLRGISEGSLKDQQEYERAEEAIRTIGTKTAEGTNGIATVLRLMASTERELNVAGLQAFVIAKANLASAVPELVRIYELEITPDSMRWVAGALGNLGLSAKAAAPALVRGLRHPDRDVRRESVGALMHIRGEAKVVIPALRTALQDPRFDMKDYALAALSQYGEEARSVLPEVLAIYREGAAGVRMDSDPKWAAELALRSMAPEKLEGVVVVEDETPVRLHFSTPLELYAEFADKSAAFLTFREEDRGVLIWAATEGPGTAVTGGRFEFYRAQNPPEQGAFLRSEFEVEKVMPDRAVHFISFPSIWHSISGGKLFMAARDPKGKPLKIWRVRREDWDDWERLIPLN